MSSQPIVWISARQAIVSHTSTESEYVGTDTRAKVTTWISSLSSELRVLIQKWLPFFIIDDKPTEYQDGNVAIDTRKT